MSLVKIVNSQMRKKIVNEKQIEVLGVSILVWQKRIRNLHLRILEGGAVRVSAPLYVSLKDVTKFVSARIDWIKEKQAEMRLIKKDAPPQFIAGEEHKFFGKKLRLQVCKNHKVNTVKIHGEILELHCKNPDDLQQKAKIIENFFRKKLSEKAASLIAEYEQKMMVKIAELRIKKMTTRWGTCNAKASRIWLSLALIKKPLECLELIVVHEMTHLFVRKHNQKFYLLMDKFLPEWREFEKELKERA